MLKVFEVKTDSGRWFFHKDSIIGVSDVCEKFNPYTYAMKIYCIGNTIEVYQSLPENERSSEISKEAFSKDEEKSKQILYNIRKEILEILEERDADC